MNGVVDQIAGQRVQRRRLSVHHQFIVELSRTEVDAACIRKLGMISEGLTRDLGQAYRRLRRGRRGAGLLARQGQQLLHHVGGALQPGTQLHH